MCAPSRIHTMDRAVVAHVDKTSCAASLAWVRRCPSALLDSTREDVSEINEVLAKAVAGVHLNHPVKAIQGARYGG